jgi:heat shock protein HslJ
MCGELHERRRTFGVTTGPSGVDMMPKKNFRGLSGANGGLRLVDNDNADDDSGGGPDSHSGDIMKSIISAFFFLTVLVLSGCHDWFPPIDPDPPKHPNDTAYVDPHSDTAAKYLVGKRWCLEQIKSGGSVQTVDQTMPRYIEFDGAGRATGNGGHNTFGAGYTAAGGSMTITSFGSTKIWSDSTESEFFSILRSVTTYSAGSATLRLSDGNSTLVFGPCVTVPTVIDTMFTDLGKDFKLNLGGLARLNDGTAGTFVTFATVIGDSRCPSDVVCVWAGDAAITVTLWSGNNSYSGELHTNNSSGPQKITLGSYDVTLVELNPYPISTVVINPADYVAVLNVTAH